jgi:DNA/RNA-binding domain of Phe-tRNA-synthetase-like protein
MYEPPLEIKLQLDGWFLYTVELERTGDESAELARLRADVARRARERYDIKTLAADPTVAALRRLFKAAGCDPTRYRPSSEALLRRLLKGDELPKIHPLVDINNCLSAELAVPCCVMAAGTIEPPLVYRPGAEGESYQSLRGPFRLEGKPLLCDRAGPLDCPITGNERVKVTEDTRRAWLVSYMPAETRTPDAARVSLEQLAAAAPVFRIVPS